MCLHGDLLAELRAEVQAELTGPGGEWAIVEEDVLGETMPVFAHRRRSLVELLEGSRRFGDDEYMVLGDRRVSFAQHLDLVASLARSLETRHGVRAGDRVAIWAENRPEWVVAFWATVSLGAIVVAGNDRWTNDELAYALRDSEPALVISDRSDLRLGVPVLEMRDISLDAPAGELPDTPIAEDDPALILYTSGTTGRPKGALISHRALIGFVDVNACNVAIGMAMARRFGVDARPERGRILLTAPMFHVSGLFAGIILAAAEGHTLVLRAGRFDPHDVLRIIKQERITQWTPLGAMGPRVLDALAEKQYDVSSVRQLGFGGAPLSPTLRQRLMEAFPNNRGRSGMGYGSSETVSVVTSIGGPEFDEHPTSCGRVLPTVNLEIRDGEIHVRSPYIMLRYWNNEAATAETIKPGRWLATGDVGHMEDGLLYIDSRARDMILRSGENIYPVEVEHRISAHPAVAEVAVIGVDHDVLGQEVKAVVVPAPGATVDPADLAAWTRQALAGYKVPSQWEVRSTPLPRNAAGKVLKQLL
jgi:long-chain acyl-CoA synthetase